VDLREERCPWPPAILEIQQRAEPSRAGDAAEERGRALVRRHAGGDQQAHDAVRPHDLPGALDEQRVQVDVAAREQRIALLWQIGLRLMVERRLAVRTSAE
jgi:hypothetical protein